ncbi:MAG: hypothetical protein HRT94_06705 [Alphaproteobacteria bacterium]|nr:hypothetical protein [Alphaproteobacteria bacterium]
MQQAGVRNVCLEHPIRRQPVFDNLANGTMPPNEFAAYMVNELPLLTSIDIEHKLIPLAEGIKTMADAGIAVHAIDSNDEVDNFPPVQVQIRRELEQLHRNACEVTHGEISEGLSSLYTLLNPIKLGRALIIRQEDIRDLRGNDEEQSARVMHASEGEKTVVLIGSLHLEERRTSMKNILGAENASHVELFHDRNVFKMDRRSNPDFLFFVDQQQLYDWQSRDRAMAPQRQNSMSPA